MDLSFTKKEIVWIIIALLLFAFITGISIKNDKLIIDYNLNSIIIPVLIIFISIIAKKIAANFSNIKIEHEVWKFQRWGWYKRSYFKKPFPIGIVLPFFIAVFSLGIIKPLTFLQFHAKNLKEKRILRQIGRIRKTEINEYDLSFTSSIGFYSLIILSIIGIIFKYPELAKYPIYYGMWNLVPFGGLDGTKIFFWNAFHWIFLVILHILFLIGIIMFI